MNHHFGENFFLFITDINKGSEFVVVEAFKLVQKASELNKADSL